MLAVASHILCKIYYRIEVLVLQYGSRSEEKLWWRHQISPHAQWMYFTVLRY